MKTKEPCVFEVKAVQGETPRKAKRIAIEREELILMAQSYKYTAKDILQIFHSADLVLIKEWSNDDGDCSVYLLERWTSGTNAPVNV